MKKLILALLVGVCLVRVFAVGNFRTVNSISELVSTNNNPKNILTNYFVVDVSRMFAWFNTATNTTNTTTVFESLYVKNILGTNIGRFLQVFSNSLEGATVTNLTVITQTVNNITVNSNTIINGGLMVDTNVFNVTSNSITMNSTNITINTNITIGRTNISINGTNLALINPTDNTIPYRLNSTALADSSLTVTDSSTVQGTNITAEGQLITDGAFATRSLSLSFANQNATNTITCANQSMVVIASLGTNATICLTAASVVTGQHLYIANYWTNASFSLFSGTTCSDTNQLVVVRGDEWTPTETGETIHLIKLPGAWVEVGRSNPNGTTPGAINPTDGFLPYRADASSFGDSPLFRVDPNTVGVDTMDAGILVVTNLQSGGVVVSDTNGVVVNLAQGTGTLTNDGAGNLGWIALGSSGPWTNSGSFIYLNNRNPTTNTPILIDTNYGAIFSGIGAYTNYFANGFPAISDEVFVSVHDPNVYGPAKSSKFFLYDFDLGYANYADAEFGTDVTEPTVFYSGEIDSGTGPTRVNVITTDDPTTPNFRINKSGVNRFIVQPFKATADTNTWPYEFDTQNSVSGPGLVRFGNNRTNQLTFGPLAQINFGEGTTNVIYRNGAFLNYTNGAANVDIKVWNGSGKTAAFGLNSGGQAEIRADGSANALSLSDGSDTMTLFGGNFGPATTITLGSAGSFWSSGAIGSTNIWKLKSVTEGVTTNIVVNINGKDYTFQAW